MFNSLHSRASISHNPLKLDNWMMLQGQETTHNVDTEWRERHSLFMLSEVWFDDLQPLPPWVDTRTVWLFHNDTFTNKHMRAAVALCFLSKMPKRDSKCHASDSTYSQFSSWISCNLEAVGCQAGKVLFQGLVLLLWRSAGPRNRLKNYRLLRKGYRRAAKKKHFHLLYQIRQDFMIL